MEFGIVCGLVLVALAIYGACKGVLLVLFPISYHLENQPLREAVLLARTLNERKP